MAVILLTKLNGESVSVNSLHYVFAHGVRPFEEESVKVQGLWGHYTEERWVQKSPRTRVILTKGTLDVQETVEKVHENFTKHLAEVTQG